MNRPWRDELVMWLLLLACLLGALALWWTAGEAWGMHGHWTDHFVDAEGIRCCRLWTDCLPGDVLVYSQARGDLSINGMRLSLPSGSIHRMPDDVALGVSGYVCYRGQPPIVTAERVRCVFFRSGLF